MGELMDEKCDMQNMSRLNNAQCCSQQVNWETASVSPTSFPAYKFKTKAK
jgi:hypothetical protein